MWRILWLDAQCSCWLVRDADFSKQAENTRALQENAGKKTGSVFFEKQSAEDPSDVIGKAGYPISCVRWKLTGQIDKHGGSSKTSPDQSCQKLQLL